jgi:hypothetical protein
MIKRIIVLCLIMSLFGCAWQRGRTRIYDAETGNIIKDVHCWAIVVGEGQLGAICEANGKLYLASADTGFSEMTPEVIASLGTAVGKGFAAAIGTKAAANASESLLKLGSEALENRSREDIPEFTAPATEDTE